MGTVVTAWEDLKLSDDFIFGKAMQNKNLCKKLLETILKIKIEKIEYPDNQKTIDVTRDAKSVRLDVYVADNMGAIYNVEMQTVDTNELPKRTRYYQSMIDLNHLGKGQHYSNLNKSFVIFICIFDPFGKGRHIYTFENICNEDHSLKLKDETTKVFLNSVGVMDDVDKDLKAFLDYLSKGSINSEFAADLNKEVEAIKRNDRWRCEYMTLLMRDQENYEKGLAKGREENKKAVYDMLHNLMENANIPLDEAMRLLGIDLSQKSQFANLL